MRQCPKCNRQFQKTNQMHSCRPYALENHFTNKDKAKELFEYYKQQIEKNIGPVKIESLKCRIHFVGRYFFGACRALRDKMSIDFRIDHPLVVKREHRMN